MKSIFFKFDRMGRARFLAYTNITYGFLAFLYYLSYGSETVSIRSLFTQHPFILILLIVVSFLPLKFLAQRYKDSGLSGWWALVGLIPYSYTLLYLLMGFFHGEKYRNQHGDMPTKSNIFLQVIAYFPLIIIVSFSIWYYLQNGKLNKVLEQAPSAPMF